MDREFLEDYEQKELKLYANFLKKINEGKFSFDDRYPSNDRFIKPQIPMALTTLNTATEKNIWSQIPFCGSLVLPLPPWSEKNYERFLFKLSKTQQIIDFIKETGKIQFILNSSPLNYEGLDYLDPFLKELDPPYYLLAPAEILGSQKNVQKTKVTFHTLAEVNYFNWLKKLVMKAQADNLLGDLWSDSIHTYVGLKLMKNTSSIVEELENLLIDDPEKAGFVQLDILCKLMMMIEGLCALMFALEEGRKTIQKYLSNYPTYKIKENQNIFRILVSLNFFSEQISI